MGIGALMSPSDDVVTKIRSKMAKAAFREELGAVAKKLPVNVDTKAEITFEVDMKPGEDKPEHRVAHIVDKHGRKVKSGRKMTSVSYAFREVGGVEGNPEMEWMDDESAAELRKEITKKALTGETTLKYDYKRSFVPVLRGRQSKIVYAAGVVVEHTDTAEPMWEIITLVRWDRKGQRFEGRDYGRVWVRCVMELAKAMMIGPILVHAVDVDTGWWITTVPPAGCCLDKTILWFPPASKFDKKKPHKGVPSKKLEMVMTRDEAKCYKRFRVRNRASGIPGTLYEDRHEAGGVRQFRWDWSFTVHVWLFSRMVPLGVTNEASMLVRQGVSKLGKLGDNNVWPMEYFQGIPAKWKDYEEKRGYSLKANVRDKILYAEDMADRDEVLFDRFAERFNTLATPKQEARYDASAMKLLDEAVTKAARDARKKGKLGGVKQGAPPRWFAKIRKKEKRIQAKLDRAAEKKRQEEERLMMLRGL